MIQKLGEELKLNKMQLLTSKTINFFHETFKKKFGFENYISREKPTVFFGIYHDRDMRAVENHNGVSIVWLAGSDAMVDGILKRIKELQDKKGITVIAESHWIKKDLDRFNIKYEEISLFMDNIYNWGPVPLGDSLYWYNAGTSKYGKQYLSAVKKEFPDLNIITNDHKTTPRDKMNEVYARCFAGIRPIEHDGQSQTVAEMGLMGRMSIYNGDGPFCVPFNDAKSLIEAIKRLRRGYNPKIVARRARGYFLMNEAKWTDLVLRLCGTDELDITNIFYEDKKRSGSIFRIVKKSDIEKIGGFGQDQFERKWFCSKMQELGKKQLICSKNSGFVAKEFKNSDKRKGYPDNVEFNTHDRGTI